MENPLKTQIDYTRYVHLLWKWKWLVLLPAVVFPLTAGYRAMQFQDQFKSTTLILVQPQKVPTQFVPTTVTTGIEERLQTISQQIFSRTRLEQIIQEFKLFEKEKQGRTPEEIVDLMRSRIDLKVHRSDAFQLSFIDANPRLAMLVTNKLASLFIEENLKVREQQAIGTSQFLGDEIDRYREKVRERELAIFQFKKQHMAEMPEQLTASQSRLGQLQSQLQIVAGQMNAAEDRRVQLQQQVGEIERRAQEPAGDIGGGGQSLADLLKAEIGLGEGGGAGVDERALLGLLAESEKRRAQVEALLLSHTEKHPDVVRARSELARLEERIAEERKRLDEERQRLAEQNAAEEGEEPPVAEPRVPAPSEKYPPVYAQLKADLARAELQIERLNGQRDRLEKEVEVYQQRIGATPARQIQLQQLSEDYDNLKAVLEGLINKKLQADLAENLERKQKGEQFQILDPANLPEKPFYPQRLRWVQGGLLLGLASGFGLVFLLDFLNLGVKSRQDLASALGLPVLASIPEIITPAVLRRRRILRVGVSGALAVCLVIGAAVVHWTVKPLPRAVRDLERQVRATHWTTMKDIGVGRR